MSTKITLGIDAATRDGATTVYVEENFDRVLEQWWPVNPAGSNLESRTNAIFTQLSGDRVMIKLPSIVLIQENVGPNDE